MGDRPSPPTQLAFHFDVICPWAYQTSLWMREVRDRQAIAHNRPNKDPLCTARQIPVGVGNQPRIARRMPRWETLKMKTMFVY